MTKAPIQTDISKGQSDNTNNATKKVRLTQRLRTDLGRSVGVTTATQLVWLTGLRAQPTHLKQDATKLRTLPETLLDTVFS